jgi:hypothetical protein
MSKNMTTAAPELVTAAPVKVAPTYNDLWERLARSDKGAIVTNKNEPALIKYIYGDTYRIRFVKDKQGDEAAHQWGRVFFTPLIEDEEEVYASPRKHRPAIVKDKAAKAAA